ncbi:12974_t:CDS:1, partial [Gigaspora margarita]
IMCDNKDINKNESSRETVLFNSYWEASDNESENSFINPY